MTFNFAESKRKARQVVHSTLAVQAFYQDASLSIPLETKARYHVKQQLTGDLGGEGYATTIEGVQRVVFSASEAARLDLKRGGVLRFPTLGKEAGSTFVVQLTVEEDEESCGPEEVIWHVTRRLE